MISKSNNPEKRAKRAAVAPARHAPFTRMVQHTPPTTDEFERQYMGIASKE